MAKLESIRVSDSASRFFDQLQRRVDNMIIEDIGPAILAIDKGEFDKVVLKNGVWVTKEDGEAEPSS
jgi:hypothetical protein